MDSTNHHSPLPTPTSPFDEIRPYLPEELPQVFEELIADPMFKAATAYAMPGIPYEGICTKMRQCKTNLDFQKAFFYGLLKELIAKCGNGIEMDATRVDNGRRYTFISNHRDIVLDSAFLSALLIDAGFTTTVEIAIGDNLLIYPWIKKLVRVNKAFIVQRSVSVREMLASSKRLSDYMHYAVSEKNENIWIAQREGRAKDSNDRTQPSILKMMAMGGEGTIKDRLRQLHITPLAISYEYDPCDYLKAKEFQQKRDIDGFKKSPEDDLINMKTGIFGWKGHVHYECAECIDTWLDSLPDDMPKGELFDTIAAHIDHEIHTHYRLYPANFIALDLCTGSCDYHDRYSEEQEQAFRDYVEGQLQKVDLPHPDPDFLRQCIYKMYAYPAKNQIEAKRTDN